MALFFVHALPLVEIFEPHHGDASLDRILA